MDAIKTYDDNAEQYAKSRIGKEDINELREFRSKLNEHDRVLDIGCAAGRDTRILKDLGLDPVGVDLSRNLLKIVEKHSPELEFVLADMQNMPFDDSSVKAIWASAVLHHVALKEMKSVLREFRRVLEPGGLLYIHTKAGKGKLQTSEEFVNNSEREFELMTAELLDEMLAKAKFEKISIDVKPSKSRKNLMWVTAFYKKPA